MELKAAGIMLLSIAVGFWIYRKKGNLVRLLVILGIAAGASLFWMELTGQLQPKSLRNVTIIVISVTLGLVLGAVLTPPANPRRPR